MEYLGNTIKGLDPATTQEVLKMFYEGIYNVADYYPSNGGLKWKAIWDTLGPEFEQGKTLDVGCGPGLCVKGMREDGYEAYGIDIADLHELWAKNGVNEYCKTGNVLNLPFSDGSFDLVICTDVLEHLLESDLDRALLELFRVSRCFTALIISTVYEAEPVLNTIYCHLTVKPAKWWKNKILSLSLGGIYKEDEEPTIYKFCHRREANGSNC